MKRIKPEFATFADLSPERFRELRAMARRTVNDRRKWHVITGNVIWGETFVYVELLKRAGNQRWRAERLAGTGCRKRR